MLCTLSSPNLTWETSALLTSLLYNYLVSIPEYNAAVLLEYFHYLALMRENLPLRIHLELYLTLIKTSFSLFGPNILLSFIFHLSLLDYKCPIFSQLYF